MLIFSKQRQGPVSYVQEKDAREHFTGKMVLYTKKKNEEGLKLALSRCLPKREREMFLLVLA
jgi:hypothetical protein